MNGIGVTLPRLPTPKRGNRAFRGPDPTALRLSLAVSLCGSRLHFRESHVHLRSGKLWRIDIRYVFAYNSPPWWKAIRKSGLKFWK